LLSDEMAVELVRSLNYDFDHLLQRAGDFSASYWIARACHFDDAIKVYLESHPEATIINLGAGLDTAFSRVDNGQLTWVDLDLPQVIDLRQKLLPPPERVHYIAKSILDYSWMAEVKQFGDECFFYAGGVLMYFTEEQVKSLLIEMANCFNGCPLIFDSISSGGLKYGNKMLEETKMVDAVLKWSLDDTRKLETWSQKVKLIRHSPFFKNINGNGHFSLLCRLQMFLSDAIDKGGIIQLLFC